MIKKELTQTSLVRLIRGCAEISVKAFSMRLFLVILAIGAVPFNSSAHNTASLDMDTQIILGNRNFINDRVTLWRSSDRSASEKVRDVRILAKPDRIHDSLKNIEIFYKNKLKEISLFKESGAYINGEHITKIIKAKSEPLVLIETRFQSTGASGGGSDGKNLYIYLFDNTKVEKRKINLTDNWWGSSYNLDNKSYWLERGTPDSLYLSSLSKTTVYNFNYSELSLDLAWDDTSNVEPSFDCKQAESRIDLTICYNIGLSALDAIMSTLYLKLKKKRLIIEGQKTWLSARNNCSKIMFPESEFIRCLTLEYKRRILELESS